VITVSFGANSSEQDVERAALRFPLRIHFKISSRCRGDIGAKLSKRDKDPLEVLTTRPDHHVDLLSHIVNHSVQKTRHTTDGDVRHAVPIEDLNHSGEIERARLVFVAHDTDREAAPIFTHGSSAVRGGKVEYNSTARRPAPGGCTRPSKANT
jgi:hypothetical protein